MAFEILCKKRLRESSGILERGFKGPNNPMRKDPAVYDRFEEEQGSEREGVLLSLCIRRVVPAQQSQYALSVFCLSP